VNYTLVCDLPLLVERQDIWLAKDLASAIPKAFSGETFEELAAHAGSRL